MDLKTPDPMDIELVIETAHALRVLIAVNVPSETAYPGSTSLAVTALIWVAGELLQSVPPEAQDTVLAHFQQQMAAVMHDPHIRPSATPQTTH